MSTRCDSFSDISKVLNPTVCDDRFAKFFRHRCGIVNRCDLRNPYTGNDTGCTDRTRSDSDFTTSTPVSNKARAFACRYVSGNQCCIWECFANFFNFANYAGTMTEAVSMTMASAPASLVMLLHVRMYLK